MQFCRRSRNKVFGAKESWVKFVKTMRMGVCAAALVFATPVLSQSGGLAMLGELAKGEWTIRFRDGSQPRKVCVGTGLELIQLRHPQRGCSRFVVEESASRATVQYTCPSDGYGRTNVRRETNMLVQIESQGIANALPFQFAAEARRTGSC
jgi:hypothetical protein